MEQRRLEPTPIRFGPFEFKPASLELFRHGARVRVPVQPLRVLSALLARPGVLVSREELRTELWPDGTFVDFEHGLNAAVRRLRRGLRDSARSPRFIQTLARRGYRFIAQPLPSRQGENRGSRIDCTVAVLPFQNADGDVEIEYVADGIAESLIGRLSRISRIRVMARSATFRYKGRQSDPRTAGRRLNADYVVVGTVTFRAEELSVHAELVDVAGGWQLWSHTYRAVTATAGEIDEALAEAIVGQLGLSLSDAESFRLKKRETLNADARRHYLKARHFLNQMSERYAAHLAAQGRSEESQVAMRRAAELDPVSPIITTERAWHAYMARDFETARIQSIDALDTQPGFPAAHFSLGLANEQLGRHQEAIDAFRAAAAASPNPAIIASEAHTFAVIAHRQEALVSVRRLEELATERYVAPYWLAIISAGLNDVADAFMWLERAADQHDVWLVWAKTDPRFDPLRSDSRFVQLLATIGFD